jgi:hypothetical protein
MLLSGRLTRLERRLGAGSPCPCCEQRRFIAVTDDAVRELPVCPQCGRSPLAGPVKVYIGVRVTDV